MPDHPPPPELLIWWVPVLPHLPPQERPIAVLLSTVQERLIRLQYLDSTNPTNPTALYGLPVIHDPDPNRRIPSIITEKHLPVMQNLMGQGHDQATAARMAVIALLSPDDHHPF